MSIECEVVFIDFLVGEANILMSRKSIEIWVFTIAMGDEMLPVASRMKLFWTAG